MQLADFFIGKPGPGSLSEAVQMGLPVIVIDNAWTMPQERYNAEWIRDNGLGVVHGSFRTIDRAVAQLVARLDEFAARVGRIDNRALFEVPVMLERILGQAAADGSARRAAAGAGVLAGDLAAAAL
jgi:UDP-N-acetylglucosamine:LPS N-acetylglucosamine transferase